MKSKIVIVFPPDYDGELQVEATRNESGINFQLGFNIKENETPKDAFMRLCQEVSNKGR